jgi:hypothetical protein
MAKTKFCTGCNQSLNLAAFSNNKSLADGKQSRCKECFKEASLSRHARIDSKQREKDEEYLRQYGKKKVKLGPLAEWYLREDPKDCNCTFCKQRNRMLAKKKRNAAKARDASRKLGA